MTVKQLALTAAPQIACIIGDGTSPWLFDLRDLDNWIEQSKQTL